MNRYNAKNMVKVIPMLVLAGCVSQSFVSVPRPAPAPVRGDGELTERVDPCVLSAPEPLPLASVEEILEPPANVGRARSGLMYQVLRSTGCRQRPSRIHRVTVLLSAWSEDGTRFRNTGAEPIEMTVGDMIPGLTEGVSRMSVGDRLRFWIPHELAVARDQEEGPVGTVMVDIELRSIELVRPLPPMDATIPSDAVRTPEGLAFVVLIPSRSDKHPLPSDVVRVRHWGWTSDGQSFGTSEGSFPLDQMIRGWSIGIPLMTVGELRRFWIPANLAYEGNPRGPQGMLIMDIALLEITR